MIVIGEGYLDLYLDLEMVKLGGVFHYAHVLEALQIKSKIYHLAPQYLHSHLEELSYKYVDFYSIGEIANTPNIITIAESKETGDQKYRNVLEGLKKIKVFENVIDEIADEADEDLFILPGGYNINLFRGVVEKFNGRIFIDIAYDVDIDTLKEFNCQFDIIFISTSSEIFLKQLSGNISDCKDWLIPKFSNVVVLKENRGGSRIFKGEETFFVSAQLSKIAHSVGVGDCYNIALISKFYESDPILAGKFASKVASIYGQCTKLHDFQSQITKLKPDDYQIEGVNLPWEERKKGLIYIAAPDFKSCDTRLINDVCEKLKYHNFNPIRPIETCGEIDSNTPPKKIRQIIKNDTILISDSTLVVAIILFKDEGTLSEIGYASALGKPVIIYDPFKIIKNAFVENISKKIVYSLEDLIDSIFILMSINKG